MRILIRAITHSANVSHTETCSSSRIMHATERFYFFTIKRKHFHTFPFFGVTMLVIRYFCISVTIVCVIFNIAPFEIFNTIIVLIFVNMVYLW